MQFSGVQQSITQFNLTEYVHVQKKASDKTLNCRSTILVGKPCLDLLPWIFLTPNVKFKDYQIKKFFSYLRFSIFLHNLEAEFFFPDSMLAYF